MKGQVTIIAIIMAAVSLLVLASLAPLFVTSSNLIEAADPTDTTSILLSKSMLFFVLIAIIITVLGYAAYMKYTGQF